MNHTAAVRGSLLVAAVSLALHGTASAQETGGAQRPGVPASSRRSSSPARERR